MGKSKRIRKQKMKKKQEKQIQQRRRIFFEVTGQFSAVRLINGIIESFVKFALQRAEERKKLEIAEATKEQNDQLEAFFFETL